MATVTHIDAAHEQARRELLDSLPARLEPEALAAILELDEAGCSEQTVARRLHVEPVVVALELQRERERRARAALTPTPTTPSPRSDPVALLSAREMNRLARGTHIPNCQLRTLVEGALRLNPGLTLNSVLRAAGFSDNSHGRRVLGYAAHHGCLRPPATIRPGYAARIARAIRRDPREVEGL